ncbi:SRPBCC family protein [Nonomuraea candida]|uniref:SRPBCC family protein n=1 Tax=Nonomuraea candida TaxID=359159 RepID=UPI0006935C92|nr:SRPBCC family protein [Nonomuraea candida]
MFMTRSLFRLAAGAAAGYLLAVRPWHLRWGADDREVHAEMPGDDLIRLPQHQATRAVTVGAPPATVWAWLVRLGGYRPGGTPAATGQEGPPAEPQGLKVGDVLHGEADGGFAVELLDPPHTLVLAMRGADATATCSIRLRELEDGKTRMIFRLRVRAQPTVRGTAYLAMTDVGDFLAMRRQMLAIKERAESAR